MCTIDPWVYETLGCILLSDVAGGLIVSSDNPSDFLD